MFWPTVGPRNQKTWRDHPGRNSHIERMEKLTKNVGRGPYLSCLVDYNHLEGSMDCRLRYISSSDKTMCNREIFKNVHIKATIGDWIIDSFPRRDGATKHDVWLNALRNLSVTPTATSKCPKKIPTTKSDYALSDFLQRFAWISHKMPQTLAEGFEIVDSNAPSPRTGMVGILEILGG